MTNEFVKRGLVAAGLMNISGVLIFSKAFTNVAVNNADPVVMSNFGLVMIVVWGLAYIGAATVRSGVKWLAAAFAIEKLVYVIVWVNWLLSNSLGAVYSQDAFAGVFYTIYGVNDVLFMIFFVAVFFSKGTDSQS